MKKSFSMTRTFIILSVFLAYMLSLSGVFAQARRTGTAARKSAASRENVEVKKIEGVGPTGLVRTPEYKTVVTEPKAVTRRWARVSVHYKTKDEWTDELEFRYFVLVKHQKTKKHILFTATAAYIDIPKGNHLSTVFLRPNTVARYGGVERAAVEIRQKGELVEVASNPKDTKPWWQRLPGTVRTIEGVLLNRSQTPFAFVACDNYEAIKTK